MLAKEIIVETLRQIQRDRVTATPEVYAKTFCQVARKAGLDLDECRPAKAHIDRLPEPLKTQAQTRDIRQLDDLAAFLIGELRRSASIPQRDADRVVRELIALLAKAMTPSFAEFDTAKLNETLSAIEATPAKVLESAWQTKVVKLVAERIRFDRQRISREADELDKSVQALYDLVCAMTQNVRRGEADIGRIKADLTALKPEALTQELFGDLKTKLESLAGELQTQAGNFAGALGDQEKEIARLKAQIAALNAQLAELAKENAEDYLTRVQTKRMIDVRLAELEREFERKKQDYAVLFFDIDHFKRINDTYGHEGGDRILQAVGELLNRMVPDRGMVGRYGGEEFVALLPGAALRAAADLAETVRAEVEKSTFQYQKKAIKMTLSCGVAVRSGASGMDSALREADARLYTAKKSGRNRVVFMNEAGLEPLG